MTGFGALAACGRPEETSGTDFVLVHGAWHSGAAWAEVSFELAAANSRPCALDLPGAGPNARFPASYLTGGQEGFTTEPSPLRDLTLEDVADAVVEALRRLAAGRRVVLVAHSLGGLAVTRAAEKAPELVDHLVYVAALVPTLLRSAAGYLGLPEAGARYPGLYVGDPAKIGATRLNFRSTDAGYRDLLHRTFYGDVDEERYLAFTHGLVPDNPTAIARAEVEVTEDRWGSIPRSYILTTQDRVVTPALQQRMITDADHFAPAHPFQVRTIDSSHSPFASKPQELAHLIRTLSN
ncbi:alpha/beta fold hydrolase [Amycolatopsis jiangsuensis]|uniref:Pimeloyl-ACP methyl ester carboxylesterase n=1 Tax=Amycolatopsis jiangsuensis TaxID=1181879 RepID=A0A840J2Q0_9PSEU|nr:alpha/beta fold hydrolase [Amycolatopsis jiangsuensis]MBB4688330.1 pimeloyl-ACP methyl ester carboxylesterase [Amycolatopsis jiangsuensis]